MTPVSPFQAVAVCSALLYAKFIVTAITGAGKKFATGNRAPEDEAAKPGKEQAFGLGSNESTSLLSASEKAAKIEDIRWQRILSNDVENIPLGLIIAYGAANSGGNATVTVVAIVAFTLARFLHTIAYANGWLYPRITGYGLGILSTFVLAGNAVAGAFSSA
ncbi:hypothetical protein ACHHYP_11143 [Achlya hypogyna]|uniref:Microsomal glutathione S-transferase 1 n=1 Tax=Achlya hypogyna TaxID=1202772 RepID=A0A1V9YJS1_ACHHY|nr:hypothetical protein ACHHYP_11143 [Achlya hypogyna]